MFACVVFLGTEVKERESYCVTDSVADIFVVFVFSEQAIQANTQIAVSELENTRLLLELELARERNRANGNNTGPGTLSPVVNVCFCLHNWLAEFLESFHYP